MPILASGHHAITYHNGVDTLMIYNGERYKAVIGNIGATITRKADGANVFLQGEDADEISSQMNAVDATAERGYPIGPFASYKQHIDTVLDAYDTVMTVQP